MNDIISFMFHPSEVCRFDIHSAFHVSVVPNPVTRSRFHAAAGTRFGSVWFSKEAIQTALCHCHLDHTKRKVPAVPIQCDADAMPMRFPVRGPVIAAGR
jgi:hypothetical protein